MERGKASKASCAVVLALSLVGCASQKSLVKQMYRKQFNCRSFEVRELEDGHWEAKGCANLRQYRCETEPGFFETRISCQEIAPDLSKTAPIELIQRMHRKERGCGAVAVWPVSDGVYEARGCGPTTLYECVTERAMVTCEKQTTPRPRR